jgi:uncharacterized damage-inducible protein DinB
MSASRMSLIAALEQTNQTLVRLTSALSDQALDFHPAAQEWSIREVLAHFVDDEIYIMRLRLERIVKEERPHLAPHDEKAWHASRNTTRDHLNELLSDFALQRSASLGMLKMLRESDWTRQGYQPEYGWFTAEGWLERWVEHDTVHLQQIEKTLSAYQLAC